MIVLLILHLCCYFLALHIYKYLLDEEIKNSQKEMITILISSIFGIVLLIGDILGISLLIVLINVFTLLMYWKKNRNNGKS